jgi:hypothetical protein
MKKNDEKIKFLSAPKLPKLKKKELHQSLLFDEPVDKHQTRLERLQRIKDASKDFTKQILKKKKLIEENLIYQ